MSFILNRYTSTHETEETQTREIARSTLHIGRGTGNEVHLDDFRVSLQHATIERVGQTYALTDLDSANGTYVNSKAINQHQLADGDEIQIGPYTLHVRMPTDADAVTITVAYTDPGHASDSEDDVTYLAKYALATGWLTKSRLTMAAMVVILGGLVTVIALGRTASGKRLFTTLSPGQVSTSHTLFEQDCAQCHQGAWQSVTDTACTTCHSGSIHQQTQAFTPSCVTCHQEHRSRQKDLTVVADQFCTQCHADLHTRQDAPLQFAGKVTSFVTDHPEFSVAVHGDGQQQAMRRRLSTNPQDTARIKLNHAVHLKADKMGAHGFEQLTCASCHQADAQGAYMLPVTFEEHCMQCHPLAFDARLPHQAVPHEKPEAVHAFLVSTFTQQVLDHLEDCEARVHKPLRRRPGHPPTPEEAQSIKACVDGEVRAAERYLFADKTCKECHTLTSVPESQLPVVAKTAIPARWFPHGAFNHQVHVRAGRKCEDCHRGVPTSTQTSDVLLPGIATCQECHVTTGGARTACVTCHTYHDKTKTRDLQARLHQRPPAFAIPPP